MYNFTYSPMDFYLQLILRLCTVIYFLTMGGEHNYAMNSLTLSQNYNK